MSKGPGFSEEHLYDVGPETIPEGVTADGHAISFQEQPNGQLRFLWDGVEGEPFDEVLSMRDGSNVFWSDDGRHLAYIGVRSGRSFVGRDGAEDPPFDSISGSIRPTFAPDGARLAYGARAGGASRLIVDGEPISQQPIAPINCVFSADGTRLAYVEVSRPDDPKAELRIVVDGVPGHWLRGMRNAEAVMQFSPDGRRLAYYEIDDKGRARWVVDDSPQQWIIDSPAHGVEQARGVGVLDPPMPACFSPDGRRFAYAADVPDRGPAVVEDDRPGPSVQSCGWPVFSPDSQRLAYVAEASAERRVIIVDGAIEYEGGVSLGEPVFSPDGRHVAAVLQREEGGFFRKRQRFGVVLDDEVIGEAAGSEASARPVFSPDGKRVAWRMLPDRGPSQIYLDGTPLPEFSDVSEPIFSSSGALVFAAAIASGGVTVAFDRKLGPRASQVLLPAGGVPLQLRDPLAPFRLSADGRHVAWAATFDEPGVNSGATLDADGPWPRPVLDDWVGPEFHLIHGWSFDTDGTASWWAQRGDAMYRVTAAPHNL